MKKVKKAILPVAGFGTRFLPATKSTPKEMLPVVDKPVIQYLVEQSAAAGIKDITFVTGRGKRAIEDHFDKSFELDHNLVEKGKNDLVKKVQSISKLARFSYVRQPAPLGDGHAIDCASHLMGKGEPVLIFFGDTLYDAEPNIATQVIEAYDKHQMPIIGLAEVPMEEVSSFGVIDGDDLGDGSYKIKGMVEKPTKEEAPSNLVAVGIYVITAEIFKILSEMEKGQSGEIRLADAFDIYLKNGGELYGKKLKGEWLDTGNKLSFIKATLKLGIKHEEIGGDLKKIIKDMAKDL
ncbi:MAG: UTP--glucose-1-phosphate uridylyltransferase [Patescibacteria group bacterium]|jgi:UTP--glucose-1-phosphate uridylyltransferase|nr:UTP--glucose-1-phosphate uridylyltransferase [Patescibacteria group bacterium]